MEKLKLVNAGSGFVIYDDEVEAYKEPQIFYPNGPVTKRIKRDSHLRQKYGMSQKDYEKRLESQSGGCEICGSSVVDNSPDAESRPFNVDHCHSSGKVRGLLCTGCNTMIGFFEKALPKLDKIIEYLGLNIKVVSND